MSEIRIKEVNPDTIASFFKQWESKYKISYDQTSKVLKMKDRKNKSGISTLVMHNIIANFPDGWIRGTLGGYIEVVFFE